MAAVTMGKRNLSSHSEWLFWSIRSVAATVAVVKAVVEQLATHSQGVRENRQNSSSAAYDN